MRLSLFSVCLCVVLFTGCSLLRQTPKYSFADGTYNSNVLKSATGKVYVHNDGENIKVYPLKKPAQGYRIDTMQATPMLFAQTESIDSGAGNYFRQNSFDVDFLTIPFKYRFPVQDFPRQFTSNINGAVYLGYRSDVYVLHYPATLLGKGNREITHFGFSVGGFTGLGATAMNPWVTSNAIAIEYDGMVWSKGISGIVALNNFTTGLALGWDHLLDRHRKHWLYQSKPWIGFVFGLNLN